MSPPSEPLNFHEVTEVYRREQRTKNVTEIRRDFYPALRDLVDRIRKEGEKEMAIDQFSAKATILRNQLKKVCEKAIQIFDFRIEKIILTALRAASGSKVDLERLTPEEREFYERIYALITEYRSTLIGIERHLRGGMATASQEVSATVHLSDDQIKKEDIAARKIPDESLMKQSESAEAKTFEAIVEVGSEGVSKISGLESSADSGKSISSTSVFQQNRIILRILEDLPTFAGPSRNYCLRKEDVVILPVSIAKVLLAKGKAVEIKPRFMS
ncbi:MAG: DNA replication complex GINS family protein [Methanomassiliicoccales archaeon]|nr:DNA replication complex GINS family protein [Methanomassiliicoccales archaeon]